MTAQPMQDRLRRPWCHPDFFQFESRMHTDLPGVAHASRGNTTQLPVPLAPTGSGFTRRSKRWLGVAPIAFHTPSRQVAAV